LPYPEPMNPESGKAEWELSLADLAAGGPGGCCGVDLHDHLVPLRGRWEPAASEALPELLRHAENSGLPARGEVLGVVDQVAHAALVKADERWPAAWSAAVPRLLALLDDPDEEVRLTAVLALGACRGQDEAVVRALLDRWAVERAERLRLALVIAIGELGRVDELTPVPEGDDSDANTVAVLIAIARRTGTCPVGRLVDALCGDLSAFLDMRGYDPRWRPVAWAAESLSPEQRTELLLGLVARPVTRFDALMTAANMVTERPSETERLLPVFGALLDTPERGRAAALLAHLAPASAEYADRLFALVDDHTLTENGDEVRDFAMWALLRLKDRRCVEPLLARLEERGFEEEGRGSWILPTMPGLCELLADAGELAAGFLPWICDELDRSKRYRDVRPMLRVLRAWGTVARPAAPHVVAHLKARDSAMVACGAETLAEIGADDERTRSALGKIVVTRRDLSWNARSAVATAVARLGGDQRTAVDLLEEGLRRGELVAVERAAGLGTAARRLEGGLRSFRVRGGFDRIAVVAALARVTGDVAEALPVLLAVLTEAQPRRTLVDFEAVRALATLGPLPAEVAPVVRELLSRDERFCTPPGFDAFREDEQFRRDAARALANCAG
jgi:hypothetical protein